MTSENRSPLPPLRGEHVSHDSQLREFVPIYLKYLALTLLTLGVYHFWARTHVRRFLWDHTRFLDDPLEYLGRPVELLLGFLLVLGLFLLPLGYVNTILAPQLAADPDPENAWKIGLINFGQAILIICLFNVGTYTARRYRLSRTAWRGIRGAQTGSAWLYGIRALLYWFLTSITLGWFYPSQTMRLAKRRIENSYFGDQRFSFTGKGSDLRGAFARFWFGVLALMIIFLVVLRIILLQVIESDMELAQLEEITVRTGVFTNILLNAGVFLLFLIYRSHEVREIAGGSRLGNIRFRYTFTTWQYLRYVMGNILIFVLTLTTGWAFLQRRQFGFWQRHLEIRGSADIALVGQTREAGPRAGEGLAETFDIGFDIGF